MLLSIDFESDTPIYIQLKKQIVKGIARGDLQKGESLPSVRQLAEDIGINMHTVNKAYTILKNEGFIIMDRRIGAVINPKGFTITEEYEKDLLNDLDFLIAEANIRNMKKEDFINLCRELYSKYNKEAR